jgi:hypothetical protein
MYGESSARRTIGVVAVLATLLAVLTLAGCGDSPYKAAAKAIVQQLTTTADVLQAQAESAGATTPGSTDEQIAALAAMQEAATGMIAAVAKADADLRALTPPDVAAEAFQSAYLSDLKDYSDNLKTFTGTVEYMGASLDALKGVVPEAGEAGVWTDIADVAQAGLNAGNVAQIAGLLDTATPRLAETAQKWEVLVPVDEAQAEHQAILTDLQKVHDTVARMSALARIAAGTGSETPLSELALQWELAVDQADTLVADLDALFNKLNGLTDSTTNRLNGIQSSLDEMAKSLNDL